MNISTHEERRWQGHNWTTQRKWFRFRFWSWCNNLNWINLLIDSTFKSWEIHKRQLYKGTGKWPKVGRNWGGVVWWGFWPLEKRNHRGCEPSVHRFPSEASARLHMRLPELKQITTVFWDLEVEQMVGTREAGDFRVNTWKEEAPREEPTLKSTNKLLLNSLFCCCCCFNR